MSERKFSKRDEILKLRAAEKVLEVMADDLEENREEIRAALRERGEIPSDETGY